MAKNNAQKNKRNLARGKNAIRPNKSKNAPKKAKTAGWVRKTDSITQEYHEGSKETKQMAENVVTMAAFARTHIIKRKEAESDRTAIWSFVIVFDWNAHIL